MPKQHSQQISTTPTTATDRTNRAAYDRKVLRVRPLPHQTLAQATAQAALEPALNAGLVVDAYQGNLLGNDLETGALITGLTDSMSKVNDGDLTRLEAMLVGQATALQTIFTSLARRAQHQEYQRNLEAFLGLAMKAQAQSRATIQAVIDLKFPRQATFVKQANIAHGPQQVNNGPRPDPRASKTDTEPNKLLEGDHDELSSGLDTRAAQAAKRGDPALEAVDPVQRAYNRSR